MKFHNCCQSDCLLVCFWEQSASYQPASCQPRPSVKPLNKGLTGRAAPRPHLQDRVNLYTALMSHLWSNGCWLSTPYLITLPCLLLVTSLLWVEVADDQTDRTASRCFSTQTSLERRRVRSAPRMRCSAPAVRKPERLQIVSPGSAPPYLLLRTCSAPTLKVAYTTACYASHCVLFSYCRCVSASSVH